MEPTPEDIAAASPALPARRHAPDAHRLLPQAPDAERGLLSSFLLCPSEIGAFCIEKNISPDWMHSPAHAAILSVLLSMWNENRPIDLITVTQRLRDLGQLDFVGGPGLITDIQLYLPTAANASYYLEICREKVLLRDIIKVGTEHAARAYDEQGDAAGLLESFEKKVLAIRKGDDSELKSVFPRDGIMEAVRVIESIYERRGGITGLPTGFSEVDKMLDGLHPAEMIVIAARPSMGKSAIAMNIAEHISLHEKKPVAFFSLEMSSLQLHIRLLCSRAKVNMHRVREGFLGERDFPALTAAASVIAESQLCVIDATGASITAISAHARRLHKRHGIAAVFVDYLQLVRSLSRQAQNSREREISEISAGLKAMSKELNIPVVALAQLNRDGDKRTGGSRGRPRLSDLRESGSIEQDADVVLLLTRDEYYAEDEETRREVEGQATLIVAKQRCGPVGDVPLTFIKEYARFTNRARDTEDYASTQDTLI